MKKPVLSKSTFVRGCKCLKALHLYKHQYHLRDETSRSQQAIFDQGQEVGVQARKLFPGGTDCTVDPAYNYAASIAKTNTALKSGATTLYESGFIFNGVYAALDILVIKNNEWYVYEVKSAAEVKDYHYMDAALQYYILKGLGKPVKAVNVVIINNQYVRQGAVVPKKLFTIINVTKEANANQLFVAQQLPVMKNVVASKTTPNMKIGPQCSKYYSCDFEGHCWNMFDNIEFPVYTIKRIAENKLWDLVGKKILCQSQVPVTYSLSEHQKIQVHANRTKTSPKPDTNAIRKFLNTIKGPVAFLDFETFSSAIPLFDDVRPYQQVPFQYSVHLLHSNGTLHHFEYIADGKTDGRKELVVGLIEALKESKTVLCYNVSFEKKRIEELMVLYPQYAGPLKKIIAKLVDLIVPFRSKHVYDYKMNGSASLKSVLPALLPHLSYDELEIKEGGTASQSYLNMFIEDDALVIAKTRQALLEYCKMDTLAMVELMKWLKGLVGENLKLVK